MTLVKGHSIRNTGRTHWQSGHEPWNKGKSYPHPESKTGWDITCKVCGTVKYYQLWEHKRRLRVYCSLACYHKDSQKENPGYMALHGWVYRQLGRALQCVECGDTKTVDWANISHEYRRDISDWKQLCRKHHIAYDKA